MDNVADPQMLYQLISASAHAKRCFDKQPIGYLKASLANLPADLRQIAIAYVIEAEHELDSDGTPVQDRSCEDDKLWTVPILWPKRHSKIADALDKYLGSSLEFPKDLHDPLRTLKALSASYEAIDTLSNADIWVSVAQSRCEADPSQMKHRVNRGLWYLELFCTIFHQDCLAREDEQNSFEYRVSISTVKDQHAFLSKLGFDGVDALARVWDDIFIMLQNVYAMKLAHIFEERYIWMAGAPAELERISMIRRQRGVNPAFSGRKQLISEAKDEFDGLLNYRMSLGVVYYAAICSTRSSRIMSMDYEINPKEKSWTEIFSIISHRHFGCARHGWLNLSKWESRRFQYQLHRPDDKEPHRPWESFITPCSNMNSNSDGSTLSHKSNTCNAAGEIDGGNLKDDDSERTTDDDERPAKRLRVDPILDYPTRRGWNLEIVLGASLTTSSERYLMIDEPIFLDHCPLHQGWINPDPVGKPFAKTPPDRDLWCNF